MTGRLTLGCPTPLPPLPRPAASPVSRKPLGVPQLARTRTSGTQ